MAVLPKDFLLIAEELMETGNKEIHYRTAASQAYYSIYHQCVPIAKDLHDITIEAGVHERMILKIEHHAGTGEKDNLICQLGELIRRVRNIRVKADYKINEDFKFKDVNLAIYLAKEIAEHCEKIASL